MLIAGFATGTSHGIIYVRAEYPIAVMRLERAVAQAREVGEILGQLGVTAATPQIEVWNKLDRLADDEGDLLRGGAHAQARGVGGLNHFLLPEAPRGEAAPWRFGDAATHALAEEPAHRPRVLVRQAPVSGEHRPEPFRVLHGVWIVEPETLLEPLQVVRVVMFDDEVPRRRQRVDPGG